MPKNQVLPKLRKALAALDPTAAFGLLAEFIGNATWRDLAPRFEAFCRDDLKVAPSQLDAILELRHRDEIDGVTPSWLRSLRITLRRAFAGTANPPGRPRKDAPRRPETLRREGFSHGANRMALLRRLNRDCVDDPSSDLLADRLAADEVTTSEATELMETQVITYQVIEKPRPESERVVYVAVTEAVESPSVPEYVVPLYVRPPISQHIAESDAAPPGAIVAELATPPRERLRQTLDALLASRGKRQSTRWVTARDVVIEEVFG